MAKITNPKDPKAGTRKRTTKARGKWETALTRNSETRNSTTSWNRSTKPLAVKKGTKNINKR